MPNSHVENFARQRKRGSATYALTNASWVTSSAVCALPDDAQDEAVHVREVHPDELLERIGVPRVARA